MEVGSGGQNVYGYDGAGLRVKAVANGGAPIYYVRSSVLGNVAMEVEGSQAILYRAYIYAKGRLVAERSTDGQFYWVHKDHIGNGHKLTNTSGALVYRAEFDPFGHIVYEWSSQSGGTSLNSRKFTAYERDWATGLDYALARTYTSTRGRFMQSDPVGLGGGGKKPDILAGGKQRKPQSLNRYSYVQNDPINFVDPFGLNLYYCDHMNSFDDWWDSVFVDSGFGWGSGWGGGGCSGSGGGGWGDGWGLGETPEECRVRKEKNCNDAHRDCTEGAVEVFSVETGVFLSSLGIATIVSGGAAAIPGAFVYLIAQTASVIKLGIAVHRCDNDKTKSKHISIGTLNLCENPMKTG